MLQNLLFVFSLLWLQYYKLKHTQKNITNKHHLLKSSVKAGIMKCWLLWQQNQINIYMLENDYNSSCPAFDTEALSNGFDCCESVVCLQLIFPNCPKLMFKTRRTNVAKVEIFISPKSLHLAKKIWWTNSVFVQALFQGFRKNLKPGFSHP